MEILCLDAQAEHIRKQDVQRAGEIAGGVQLQIGRIGERRIVQGARSLSVHRESPVRRTSSA
jgi:hypothetical protein